MQEYSVIFVNNSNNLTSACLFQKMPRVNQSGLFQLAWQASKAYPTVSVRFQWTVSYDFIWGKTGKLEAGISFFAAQVVPANLSTTNQITFDYLSGAYLFKNQSQGAAPNSLTILESAQIPADQTTSIGIGMSGKGTCVLQASPNLNVNFTPDSPPQYFITAGDYAQGDVLPSTILNAVAPIVFPTNVYSMTAILKQNNTWDVQTTQAVNAIYLEALSTNPKAKWGIF